MLNNEDFIKYDNELYVVCKRIYEKIGMTVGQWRNETRKLVNDPFLSKYSTKLHVPTCGGVQEAFCLHNKCLSIWLSKINLKILTDAQYKNLMDIINECMDSSYITYKNTNNIYDFESHLRDEIFNIGGFDEFSIVDKEVIYDFGRIDLLAVDNKNNKVCIELKKYKEFDDTKLQLLRYRDSNEFVRVVYMAFIIDDEFNKWCKNNKIEAYTYKRKLEIEVA